MTHTTKEGNFLHRNSRRIQGDVHRVTQRWLDDLDDLISPSEVWIVPRWTQCPWRINAWTAAGSAPRATRVRCRPCWTKSFLVNKKVSLLFIYLCLNLKVSENRWKSSAFEEQLSNSECFFSVCFSFVQWMFEWPRLHKVFYVVIGQSESKWHRWIVIWAATAPRSQVCRAAASRTESMNRWIESWERTESWTNTNRKYKSNVQNANRFQVLTIHNDYDTSELETGALLSHRARPVCLWHLGLQRLEISYETSQVAKKFHIISLCKNVQECYARSHR